MIRGSDGLEYADEAALLLREPIDNTFNGNVRVFRDIAARNEAARDRGLLQYVPQNGWTKEKVRKYIDGFLSVCPEGDPGPSLRFGKAHEAGLVAAGMSFLVRPGAMPRFVQSGKRISCIVLDDVGGA